MARTAVFLTVAIPTSSELWEGWIVRGLSSLPLQGPGPQGTHLAILNE